MGCVLGMDRAWPNVLENSPGCRVASGRCPGGHFRVAHGSVFRRGRRATYQPPLERDGVDAEVPDQAEVVVHVL